MSISTTTQRRGATKVAALPAVIAAAENENDESANNTTDSDEEPPTPAMTPALLDAVISGDGKSVGAAEVKTRKILTRAITAILMMSSFLFIVFYLGHLWVCALIVVLQTMIFKELVALRYEKVKRQTEGEVRWFRTIQWGWFVVAMVYAYGSSFLKAPMGFLEQLKVGKKSLRAFGFVDELSFLQAFSFALYSLVFTVTVLSFRKGLYKVQLIQLTWTLMTLGVVVAQLKFAVYMVHEGLFWFLFPVSLVVANDTFAYFSGMAFGKRFIKMPFLQLSPNKTWEGFLGGLLLTVSYGVLSAPVWGSVDFLRCGFHELHTGRKPCFSDPLFTPNEHGISPVQKHAVYYALFASLVAPFGGFFASAIKRAFKIKDFDSFIPGHGGVMDRMDCQMLMSLFGYVYYTTFIASLHLKLPVPQLLTTIEMLDMDQIAEVAKFALDRLDEATRRQLLGL
jgi:phosphatidate cytidylyltransferase